VANFLSGETVATMDCGLDGMLLFYTTDILKDSVVFNYREDGCMFFTHVDIKNPQPVKMSNEAASFLKGLAEGKSWY
jgi:hypothetical protein